MNKPAKSNGRRGKVFISINTDPVVKRRLKARAKAENRPLANLVETILKQAVAA